MREDREVRGPNFPIDSIKSRSDDIINRSNDIIFHSDEIVSRGNKLFSLLSAKNCNNSVYLSK